MPRSISGLRNWAYCKFNALKTISPISKPIMTEITINDNLERSKISLFFKMANLIISSP